MIKGDKIKLVKPMGAFTNVGEVCEVVGVAEDGVISFKFGGCHLGCMSYGEFEKYFEMAAPEENKVREWSEWKTREISYNDPFYSGEYIVFVKYRHNGKKVQMRNKYFKSEATCHKTDEFNLNTGLELAKRRFVEKIIKKTIEKYSKSL